MRVKKLLAFLLAFVFILSAVPFTVSAADETVINLAVADGDDISSEFDNATKLARDDTSGMVYRIVIPKGSYVASSGMHVYSNVIIDMTAGATIKYSGNATMIRFGTLDYYKSANGKKGYTGYSAGGNVTILGGTLDAGGQEKAIFKFGHLSGVTIEGVTFKNVKKVHYIEFAASENVTVKNCSFIDFQGPWGGNSNAEALQIDAAVDEHFSGFASNSDETVSRNIIVTGCTFKGLKRGLGSHSLVATSYTENVTITNNTFENIEGYAIIASNYRNCKITDNTIKNCGAGILFTTTGPSESNFYQPRKKAYTKPSAPVNVNGVIKDNSIAITTGNSNGTFANTGYGIQLLGRIISASESKSIRANKGNDYVCPEGDFRVSGVTVSNNEITINCPSYGIWLQGAAENTVTNNTITCNLIKSKSGGTGDGIRLNGSYKNTVSNNTISNITPKGGYDSDMFGINLIETSNANTVSGNTVSNPKKDGIKVENSASNKLTSNIITGVGRDGIHMVSAKKTNVASNTIKKSARDGILSEKSASLKITKNKVNKCRTAINLKSCKTAKMVSNKSTRCSNDAIKLEKSDSATIDKNTLTTQKRDGINIVKSNKIVITNNTITSSKRYGINSAKKQIKKDRKNKIKKSGKRARSWK